MQIAMTLYRVGFISTHHYFIPPYVPLLQIHLKASDNHPPHRPPLSKTWFDAVYTFRFGDHTPGGGTSLLWEAVKEREDGAVLAILRDVVSSRSILAASTHLFWNPAYPDVKAVQAHLLCQEVSSLN